MIKFHVLHSKSALVIFRRMCYTPFQKPTEEGQSHAHRHQDRHLHHHPPHGAAQHPADGGAVQGTQRSQERGQRSDPRLLGCHRHGRGQAAPRQKAGGRADQAGLGRRGPVRAYVHLRQAVLGIPPHRRADPADGGRYRRPRAARKLPEHHPAPAGAGRDPDHQ